MVDLKDERDNMFGDKKDEHITGLSGEALRYNRDTREITGGWETLRKDEWSNTVRDSWGQKVGELENDHVKKTP